MTNSKRNRSVSTQDREDSTSKKQKSIASFFASPSCVDDRPTTTTTTTEEEEDAIPAEPETHGDESFFTSSIYTDEINTMISTILATEKHLLNDDEFFLLAQYTSLHDDPKHLFVRLIMRKHGWIQKKSMKYADHIQDLDKAIADLEACHLIRTTLDDLSEALPILAVDVLRGLLKERHLSMTKSNKESCVKKLLEFSTTSTAGLVKNESTVDAKRKEKLWDSIHKNLGACVKVEESVYKIFKRLQIIFYRMSRFDETPLASSILAKLSKRNYPVYTLSRTSDVWGTRDDLLSYEDALTVEEAFYQQLEKHGDREDNWIAAWTLCENCIGLWEDALDAEEVHRPPYLRRFESGWVYTRLIEHGTALLGKLHMYELEEVMWKKLLAQRRYRQRKRGAWYERLVCVQKAHLRKDRAQKKIALDTCLAAIQDPGVHHIFLHGFHRCIQQLERDLCVPKREQHDFSYIARKKPKEVTIVGERLFSEEDNVTGRKSVWKRDNGLTGSVEQVALDHYEKQGYKGLHCENGIVKMLVMFLFWDVLFTPIPGAFETPCQTGPMDLGTDAFYESRLDIIQERLRDIESGNHVALIDAVDRRERPRQTLCTGVNWRYSYEDLIEIAECIGPAPLASLCKLYFQEFGQRQGGLPDLCCWNFEKKECLFSEVKGPKDKLSKTQQEWIEALGGFGIPVEVCHVQV